MFTRKTAAIFVAILFTLGSWLGLFLLSRYQRQSSIAVTELLDNSNAAKQSPDSRLSPETEGILLSHVKAPNRINNPPARHEKRAKNPKASGEEKIQLPAGSETERRPLRELLQSVNCMEILKTLESVTGNQQLNVVYQKEAVQPGYYGKVIRVKTDDGTGIIIDPKTATILHLKRARPTEGNSTEGLLSEDEAVKACKAFTEMAGLTSASPDAKLNFSSYQAWKQKLSEFGQPQFTHEYWEISVDYDRKGIRCESGVRMKIDAQSGKLLEVIHIPYIAPRSLAVNTTKANAIQSVRTTLFQGAVDEVEFLSDLDALKIVRPTNFWTRGPEVSLALTSPDTCLAWVVHCRLLSESPVDAEVYVDAASGEIVGGMTFE